MTPEDCEKVPFLKALPDEAREKLLPKGDVRQYGRGAQLWMDEQKTGEFSFVLDGRVKLVKRSDEGRETIIDICTTGQLLCSSAVCAMAPYCCHAVAMEPSRVAIIKRDDMLDAIGDSSGATRLFLKTAAGRGMIMCARVDEVASGQVDRRIASLLLRLAESIGERRDNGNIWLPLQLARQDIADMCGTTVETAIRIMRRMAKEDVVQTESNGFLITNYEGLRDVTMGPQRQRKSG